MTATTSARAGRGTLMVFFSRAGENYWNGGRRTLTRGNTDRLASIIGDRISCDTWRIEAADPYSDRYDPTVRRNVNEQQQDARPVIAGQLPNLASYDTVLLGSPIWNVRPPMIMSTFLEGVDLAGVRLLPFVTYAVSGAGSTSSVYRPLTNAAAAVEDPLAVRGEEVDDASADVDRWLGRNNLR